MDKKPPLVEAASATSIEFLLSDLDIAITLLDVASTTSVDETPQRNHENAHKAYDAVYPFVQGQTERKPTALAR
jgi:hypothetical protein